MNDTSAWHVEMRMMHIHVHGPIMDFSLTYTDHSLDFKWIGLFAINNKYPFTFRSGKQTTNTTQITIVVVKDH